MRLASGVLEGVDAVAPASNKVVPPDAEVPHLNQEYCQQLEEHLRQEDHKKEKKKEVKIALNSSILVILTTSLVACSATLVCRDHLSVLSADTIFLHSTLSIV